MTRGVWVQARGALAQSLAYHAGHAPSVLHPGIGGPDNPGTGCRAECHMTKRLVVMAAGTNRGPVPGTMCTGLCTFPPSCDLLPISLPFHYLTCLLPGGSVATCFNDVHVLDTQTLAWSQPAQVRLKEVLCLSPCLCVEPHAYCAAAPWRSRPEHPSVAPTKRAFFGTHPHAVLGPVTP